MIADALAVSVDKATVTLNWMAIGAALAILSAAVALYFIIRKRND
jgi:hypothetical protein